jgi:hypothetical protein
MWLEVKSLTRHVRVELDDDDTDSSSAILLIPPGSTDVQVIEWAAQCLPPRAPGRAARRDRGPRVAGPRHGA